MIRPGGSLPDAREKKFRVKGVSKSGVGADAERGSKTQKMGEKDPHYYAIKRGKGLVI